MRLGLLFMVCLSCCSWVAHVALMPLKSANVDLKLVFVCHSCTYNVNGPLVAAPIFSVNV